MRWLVWALMAGLVVLPARAGASESEKAAAEALFNEARHLMSVGRYKEAIQKLKASQESDPGLGTLLNLASCYEHLGRTASAWAQYREIAALARQSGATKRKELAERKSRELEPKLSKLTIRLDPSADRSAVRVTRDGDPVRPAELGLAIPVDPGKHVVKAAASGKAPWSTTVEVGDKADSRSVEIPALAAAPKASPSNVGRDTGAGSGTTQKTLGLVAAGVGVAGVIAGSVFGLQASSTWSNAKDHCTSYPYDCGADGKALEQDARTQATLSTVGFIVGGVGLAGGAALWFTAGSDSERAVSVGFGPTTVALKGSF